jgi:hypothetical protein
MNPKVSATCFVRQAALRSSSIANPSDAPQGASPNQPAKFLSSGFPQTPVAITAPVSHQKRSQRDATNTIVIDTTDEQSLGVPACDGVIVALVVELGLHRIKQITIEDGGLLAGEDLALERDLALGRDCRTTKMRKRDARAIIASIAARIRLCVKTVVAGVAQSP